MTDKAPPAGWVIQHAFVRGGGATFRYFNVAIADRDAAVAAVRQRVKPTAKDRVTARRTLSAGDLATIQLKAGEASPYSRHLRIETQHRDAQSPPV